MRLSYRLTLCLTAGVAVVALAFAMYQAHEEVETRRSEVEQRALTLAQTLAQPATPLLAEGARRHLRTLVDRFRTEQGIDGAAIFNPQGRAIAVTPGWPDSNGPAPATVVQALQLGGGQGQFLRIRGRPTHVFALPLRTEAGVIGALAVAQDVSWISAHRVAVLRHALAGVGIQTLLILVITVLIVQNSVGTPLRRMAHWLREERTGGAHPRGAGLPRAIIFEPLNDELLQLTTSLHAARTSAANEARLRTAAESLWTPEKLRVSVNSNLNGSALFVVSNREPYEHIHEAGAIRCAVPASGLVTALEPVLQACNGTWIAQGSGNADREMTDANDRLRVPPGHPEYTLRRIWLTPEEEEGYYLGFSNEGLWPLCHMAHTRPNFAVEDWEHYCAVNRRFADALLEEMEHERNPVVLVQDYHFALLPRMVKETRPDARVAIFWHIPWPNAEAFAICPWQREVLDGLLGADLMGFHIQAHCNNFLKTVEQSMESKVDWERFAVTRREHVTAVRAFPISVAFPSDHDALPMEPSYLQRAALLRHLGVEGTFMGLGVDRVDYTKGIPERFRGIERLLERFPAYRRKLTFVQIGAPSRTRIKRYHDLMDEVEAEASRINRRFQTGNWRPIVLLKRQHSHEELGAYYRAADFCLVTSLHDGMNLVAKEYVASREDEQGSLILSRFTGASHELTDALIVNPYDADEVATAIRDALEMSPEEVRERMQRLRAVVRERNVYRWAGRLIHELASIRLAPGSTSLGRATTGTKATIVMDIARARTAGFR